jgi:hypothetical protein
MDVEEDRPLRWAESTRLTACSALEWTHLAAPLRNRTTFASAVSARVEHLTVRSSGPARRFVCYRGAAMSDLDKARDELAARALLAAGKDGARRLAARVAPDDDEADAPEGKATAPAKSRRNKLLVIGAFALLVLVGLLGLVVSYWHWFLLVGLAGLVGLYGWSRLRGRLRTPPGAAAAAVAEPRAKVPQRVERADRAPVRAAAPTDTPEREQAREQELDEELAALKARVKK